MTSAVTTGPGDHVAPGGPFDLVVRAARAVLPEGERAVEVGVSGGSVAAVVPLGTGLAGAEVIELADDEVLLPGLVDSHVHVNEPGRTEWEGFASATRAAAAGGVTTIVDMPLNSLPPTTTVEHLDVKRERAAGQAFVDVGFWGGAVPGNTADLRPLHDEGVFGFKCFLADSGVPEFGHLEAAELRADLAELTTFDGLMIVHAEDPDTLSGAPHAPGRRYSDFLASRPAKAEQAAIAEVVEAARATGARAHVLHLSDADSLPLIAAARADGVRLTVETCPHYLSLDADHVPDGATAYKCCPPIRESDNQDRLWQGLLDGVIDIVVTDHSPATADLKEPADGDFAAAWGGVASLQLGLAVVWTEARRRGVPLGRVVRWMSSGPAGLVGLERKGGIAVGKDADLVVFAPEATFVVEPGRLHHKNPVTPYAGHGLTGVVRRTLLRGAEVTDEPAGTLLRRQEIRGQARFPENEDEKDTMTRLQPDDHAPDFTLPDTDGTPVSLASVRTGADKGVVVYFYPKAGTPGCTTEACDFRDNLASLAAAGYAVVGVSADPVEEIRAFAEAEHLTFPLLSDADHAVADAYGAWGPKTFDGRTFDGVHRCTFVVGTDGAVQRAEYDVEATGHVAALRRALVDA